MSTTLRQINAVQWHRILVGVLFVWLVILVFTAFPKLGTDTSSSSERLTRALADLEALRRQNIELQKIFRDITLDLLKADQNEAIENVQYRLRKAEYSYSKNKLDYVSPKEEPNSQYELLRRRIYSNTKEFWYFVHSGLLELQNKTQDIAPDVVDSIQYLLNLGVEHKRSLLHDIDELAEVDGYATWREKETNDLSELVQKRFLFLQNPADCKNAGKLICDLNQFCGYGCQLHHVVSCFTVAYGTKRTLILKSRGWSYHEAGWDEVFKPISETCTDPSGKSVSDWPGPGSTDTQVLNVPVIGAFSPRQPFLPLAIPEDLAPRLTRLHGDPIVWWVGQILKYLLRPQAKTAAAIQEAMTKMGFKRPIVGVHVRRTDKIGTEAAYHGIEEYMNAVEEYYGQLELKRTVDKRRIYLATDDPEVITDAKSRYSQYEIIGDTDISKTASESARYSNSSLFGIINDIHMLAMSDYLVCTFSSQFCRVAYEIMQSYFPDASARFRSLDDIYYYCGQNAHNTIAVLPHEPKKDGEMSILPGDLIEVAGNHWDGFSKGRNLRTNQTALYPNFKVKDKIETAKFPTYAEVDKHEMKEE